MSTTLSDALYRGVIPVSVADGADPGLTVALYPLVRCCLRWPHDRDLIQESLASPMVYAATLRRLQQQAMSDQPHEDTRRATELGVNG